MALYTKYCEGMFIVAQRYVKNTAEAEDAMQEAFIKAFQKIHHFKGEVTFGAWLKKIVINTCLDVIKSRKLELFSLSEKEEYVVSENTNWEVSDDISLNEIIKAIQDLPEKFKIVVQLFLLEGYDHQEIAGILSISEGASRTNLHRGKTILKQTLKHLQYGTGY